MFNQAYVHDLSPLSNWDVSKVTDMNSMFSFDPISNLSPLVNWDVSKVTDMGAMFSYCQQISDLSPLTNWKVDNVTNMSGMFESNQICDLSPISGWNVNNVTDMSHMFDDNSGSKTKTATAKQIINFVYPAGYTGKKQDSVTQTVDVPQKVSVTLTTKESKPSNNILDWVTTAESPEDEDTAPVYFQDYTVPEIKGLLEPDKLSIAELPPIDITDPDKAVISGLPANIVEPINVTVTYRLVDSNTNDAYALDSKNGLHEHANVNNNGGYDEDYWGKINVDDWNYTVNGDTITITGYKGNNHSSLIIPNGADFGFINGQNTNNTRVEISSNVMHDLAKTATRIGLSKTANKKVVASNAIWQNAFGGMTNKPGTMSYANGGIEYGSPNLTQMDLHNLDTTAITNMHALFNGGNNLTTVGDLSEWNTSNVTSMRIMFQSASSLTNIGNLNNWDTSDVTDMHNMFYDTKNLVNIGNLDNWDTSKVTDMAHMFAYATNLTNIGDLSKWNTSNVTDMNWMFANATNLTNIGDLSKWQTGNVTNMSNMFYNTKALRHLNISNWNLTKLVNEDSMECMFANDVNLTVITNDLKLPVWYQNEINNANYFWNNHIAVITNVPELIKSTGDIDNLKIDDQNASRSIFYDSKGSSDAVQVLKDANQAYIDKYEQDHPNYLLALDASVDQTDPIALANASFVTVPKEVNLTIHFEDIDPNADKDSDIVKQELAKTVELSGRSGDAADLSQVQLPTNFELSGDLPSATFGDTDSVIIKLQHKIAYIDPADGKTYNYSNMTNEEKQMAFKQLTYHLIVNGPDGEHDFGPTGFTLIHMLERDLVTGKSKLYDSENGVLKNGTYMRTGWSAVLGDFKDDTAVNDALESANKLLNDPSAKLNTSIDMLRFEYNMMDHYGDDKYLMRSFGPVLDVMTGTSLFTIGHDIATLHSYYVHKMYPDTDDEYNAMMPEVMINSIVPQNYHIEVPSFIKQESYDWSGNKGTYYTLINNDGFGLALQVGDDNSVLAHLYAPSDRRIDQELLAFPENYTIRLNVVPNEQKSSYYFVDDDNNGVQVGDPVEIKGKTDKTVAINPAIPNNYEVVGDLPTSYTFTNTKDPNKAVIEQGAYSVHTSPLVIHLKHKTETSVESLPATRTINVHLPNGTTKVYQQIIGYQRDVITDLVTKTVTRGKWTVNDVTSSFTIDGVKQLEHSYVLKNGNYNYASVKLPHIPGYKTIIRTVTNPVAPASALFAVSFMALPKPVTPAIKDVKLDKTVTPVTPAATETAELIKTEPKVATSAPKIIDLSNDTVATTPKETTWQVTDVPDQDTYRVSNGKYIVELPHISNAQLRVIANDSTKDSVLFTYKEQNTKYVFNIKFVNGHYLLTIYEIKSGKLVKLIDYNFVKSSKMIEVISDWLQLK